MILTFFTPRTPYKKSPALRQDEVTKKTAPDIRLADLSVSA